MKISSAAVLLLSNLPALANAQSCITGGFRLEFDGACTPDAVVAAYEDQVFYAAGQTSPTCATSAQADLEAKLTAMTPGMTIQGLCDQVYNTQDKVPFADAANRLTDPSDPNYMHFEQMFFNGRTDWQEEVETEYETEDGTNTNILKEDAEAVRVFYEGTSQGRRVEWPGPLTNFQSSVMDSNSLATCTTNAAMCCWPKDRQANDGNGNCATPYDENCVDKDVADNTNLCFVDMEKGNASTNFDNDGFVGFPGDNQEGEGSIHCHGFAWSNNANDHTARYKANNLFFVSMYDHMYQRGYVKNIPGAPMCGCVEQMPTVSRSDCTQVDLTESIMIEFDGSSFLGKLTRVHVDFNACKGIDNRNNDLWAYMARLYYQNDITPAQFGEAGRIITDKGCDEAYLYELNSKEMTPGYDHDVSMWTNVAGRESMKLHDGYGHRAFNKSLRAGGDPTSPDPTLNHHGIIYRACQSCIASHMKIFMRRRTPVPEDFSVMTNILYQGSTGNSQSVWDVDFSLYSTYDDALNDVNPWQCPNGVFDYGETFYGRCSPDGTRVNNQRSKFQNHDDRNDVAYFVNKAEADGLQPPTTLITTPIKGRDYAGGLALQDNVDGTIYMTGSGGDIWNNNDDFNYLSQPVDGDHTAIVHAGKISSPEPHSWSKSGIMFRTNMTPGSPYFFVFLAGTQGVCTQGRTAQMNSASHWGCVNPLATEAWLKVEKRMDTLTSFVGTQTGADGPIEWTVVATIEIAAIGESYNAGLAISSARWYAQEVVFSNYEVDAYYFPSIAPSVSSMPTSGSAITANAVASQSSTCHGGVASRAIDGITDGIWQSGSTTHTCSSDVDAWWKVDLGANSTYVINRVTVHNREDCCKNRFGNMNVEVLDEAGVVVASQPMENSGQMVYGFNFGNVAGRYVRLQKTGSGEFSLAEVEVLGWETTAPAPTPLARKLIRGVQK